MSDQKSGNNSKNAADNTDYAKGYQTGKTDDFIGGVVQHIAGGNTPYDKGYEKGAEDRRNSR
jgi:hypothetical protein